MKIDAFNNFIMQQLFYKNNKALEAMLYCEYTLHLVLNQCPL